MITPLPGHHHAPSRARRRGRFPGIKAEIMTDKGEHVEAPAAACSR